VTIPFDALIRALSDPRAFPGSPVEVELVWTHVSVVFLVGGRAYKVKRPRNLGFLDFSSLEARRRFCHEEVRLNRRLAPAVYEGVVPIVLENGLPRVSLDVVEAPDQVVMGDVIEWAVRMVRLPEDRTLATLVAGDLVGLAELDQLAERLVNFHAAAARGAQISEAASFETVWRNDRENFEQLERWVGRSISVSLLEKLETAAATELERVRPAIERRARRGVACETHGDLRLDHVYLLPPGVPGRPAGEDPSAPTSPDESKFVVIDCIEFNERFRWADPVADIAFLVMELEFSDRPDLARGFASRYLTAAGDPEGADLLPYYVAYRDIVRGKVRSLQAEDALLAPETREGAAKRATRHFLRALGRLSKPVDRPALAIVFGLPGVGKSTAARALERELAFRWIDTDVVRKELPRSGGPADTTGRGGSAPYGAGIYTAEWNERTYSECERRAGEILLGGGRVVVEGSFRRERHRAQFLETASRLGVPAILLECSVGKDEARRRLATRPRGPSDADWSVYERMTGDWDAPSERTAAHIRSLSLEGTPEETLARASALLADEGIA
jgi:aminoglycoside phosphotransferase family enzyme/predicted kinase